jgi:orotate phosphoribosyltransferase
MNKEMYEKLEFVRFLINHDALKFGDFTLKSGRKCPYFINMGVIYKPQDLGFLCDKYREEIIRIIYSKLNWTVNDVNKNFFIFGSAYKGIPLAILTSIQLAMNGYGIPYSFNRKEEKSHGDGGVFCGYQPKQGDNCIVLDDVLTSGKTVIETKEMMDKAGVNIKGFVVAFDRFETLIVSETDKIGFNQEGFEKVVGFPIYNLINIFDIVEYLIDTGKDKEHDLIINYLEEYKR